MAMMTAKELGCFTCRVGWFNGIFNPMKPDRGFRMFNVGMCQESRQLLKIYFILSVKEAGQNFIDEKYR